MTEQSVLETLRRIPDRIILAVAARDLDMSQNSACLCGWVVREHLAEIQNRGASTVQMPIKNGDTSIREDSHIACVAAFGGSVQAWGDIWIGVMDSRLPIIESAYVQRLDEAVFGRAK